MTDGGPGGQGVGEGIGEGVGEVVGEGDGEDDGAGDGEDDGAGDGEAVGAGDGEDDGETSGTFLVIEVDAESAVLRDVRTGQVHALTGHPDLAVGEVVEATIAPEPPLEVAWTIVEVESRREIPVERSPEEPTTFARDLAAEQAVGEVTRQERAGEGELHVLTVPEDETETAAADVLDDDATVARAAKLGVDRVEVRAADGVLSVRYLP